MAALAAEARAAVVLMHMRGTPKSMQEAPVYADCPAEVRAFLAEAASAAIASGIQPGRILVDPGIGFGKTLEDNLALLSRLELIVGLGYPVVVGLSRKSFVGALVGKGAEGRLAGSLGAACAAYLGGGLVFRTHDVAETVDALAVFAGILVASRGVLS
jgi:dihydropteroate synthase